MLTLIEMVTFDLVPFICMLGGLCLYLFSNRIPEINEDAINFYNEMSPWENWVPSIWFDVNLAGLEEKEVPALDSYEYLMRDLDALDIEMTGLTSIKFGQDVAVTIDAIELHPIDIDVSFFARPKYDDIPIPDSIDSWL